MWNTLPLRVRQATNIASFKTRVREFLAGNVRGSSFSLIDNLLIFLHISPYAFLQF